MKRRKKPAAPVSEREIVAAFRAVVAPRADVQGTLSDRAKSYGKFIDNATVAQQIKTVLRGAPGYERLDADMRESFDQIVSKMARLVCGDKFHVDGWKDIEGYAHLVRARLEGTTL